MEVIRECDIFNYDSAEVIEVEKNQKIIKIQQKGNDNMWQKMLQGGSGGSQIDKIDVYNEGKSDTTWIGSNYTLESDKLKINAGRGTFTNYCISDKAYDFTDYDKIYVEYSRKEENGTIGEDVEKLIDISKLTGTKYISACYITNSSTNMAYVGYNAEKINSTDYNLWNGGNPPVELYIKKIILI